MPSTQTTTASNTNTNTSGEPAKKGVMNGVDRDALFGTINHVAANPELASFQFRVSNRWVDGTHSRGMTESFSGAGGEHEHKASYSVEADHPAVLVGSDEAPSPVEHVLHALAACLTAGIGNIASARGVRLTRVTSHLEGDIDLRGILGITDEVRNGFSGIRARFEIEGDAPAEKLEQIVRQSQARSAVFDILTNGVPVDVSVEAV